MGAPVTDPSPASLDGEVDDDRHHRGDPSADEGEVRGQGPGAVWGKVRVVAVPDRAVRLERGGGPAPEAPTERREGQGGGAQGYGGGMTPGPAWGGGSV